MTSPFKFLDAYTKKDKDIFFGRSLDVKSLFEKIHNGRLLLVYGASGTGKTSLIQCGLANEFQDTDWFPLIIRRNQNIHKATLQSIIEKVITPIDNPKDISKENLISSFDSLYLDFYKPIFLIYDQFEELFISGKDDEILSFFELLNDILNSDIQIKVILVIREEYLAQLTNMEYVVPELFKNRYRIEPMSMVNITEVIVNSCKKFNIELENKVTPKLIYEKLIGENGRVALTHLQVFLDRLYKQTHEKDSQKILFSNDLIVNIGKLEDVLATFLSEQVGALYNPKLGWQILKLFITEKGTKRSIPQEELNILLKKEGIVINDGLEITKQLLENRVIRLIGTNNSYEFSHDSLAKRVFDRLSIKEKSLLEIKQFLNQEYSNYKTRNVLLSKEDLDYVNPYLDDLEIEEEKRVLIDKSKKELNRKKRTSFIVTTVVIVLLSFLSVYSLIQSRISNQARQDTEQALKDLTTKEKEKEKAEADKVLIQVNDLIERAQKLLNDKDTETQGKNRINDAIKRLEEYPNNPELVKKLKQIKADYDE